MTIPEGRVKFVDFYFDIVCPFAYLASTQVPLLAKKHPSVEFRWQPCLLGGVYGGSKAPQGKSKSAMTVMSPSKRQWFARDLFWRRQRLSSTGKAIPLKHPRGYPVKTLKVMRLLTFIANDDRLKADLPRYTKLFYEAFWIDNADLRETSVLQGLIGDKSVIDVDSVVNDDSIKKKLFETTDKAVSMGAFGVPTFYMNGNAKEMYFGVDRIDFIDHRITYGRIAFTPCRQIMEPSPYPIASSTGATNTIDFYFDFSSPWAFLGYSRLHELNGFGRINFRPVLLGAIFKAIGTPNAPMLALTPAKRAYMGQEMARWFGSAGIRVKFSSHFPIRTVTALRVAIQDHRTIDCLYRAAWQSDLNIGNSKILEGVLNRHGFDGKRLIQNAKTNKLIKSLLFENTQKAVDMGIFGVPSYVVNGRTSEFVWGQDRLDYVKDLCHGWTPSKMVNAKAKL